MCVNVCPGVLVCGVWQQRAQGLHHPVGALRGHTPCSPTPSPCPVRCPRPHAALLHVVSLFVIRSYCFVNPIPLKVRETDPAKVILKRQSKFLPQLLSMGLK